MIAFKKIDWGAMMLRHTISASLAMVACVSFIPTKASAVSLSLESVGSLQRNPGDSIEFVLKMDPNTANNKDVVFDKITGIVYDIYELNFPQVIPLITSGTPVTTTTDIARFIFNVLEPVKVAGDTDLTLIVNYTAKPSIGSSSQKQYQSVFAGDVEPVPEPLTIFGTATALGCGVLFKRKSSKKRVF